MKRAVIVGCGNIAAVHAAVLTAQKDTELVGVADIHFEKAQDYAERFHTKPYASLEEMIEKVHQEKDRIVPGSCTYDTVCTRARHKCVYGKTTGNHIGAAGSVKAGSLCVKGKAGLMLSESL